MPSGAYIWGATDKTGVTWWPIVVDATGHLQIDLASIADVNIASSDITLDVDISLYMVRVVYDSFSNPIYIGEAAPGTGNDEPYWRIKFMVYDASDNPTSLSWADGTNEFIKIWDNRTDYDYL